MFLNLIKCFKIKKGYKIIIFVFIKMYSIKKINKRFNNYLKKK
jgi:predicted RNA-binding protein associated with RNAse of E/G family